MFTSTELMLKRYNNTELVELCDIEQSHRMIDLSQFRSAINNEDISSYTTDEQSALIYAVNVLNQAIDDANKLVKSYISRLYDTSSDSSDDFISSLASDIARFNLHDIETPATVLLKYTEALEFLRAVNSGAIELNINKKTLIAEPAVNKIKSVYTERTGQRQGQRQNDYNRY